SMITLLFLQKHLGGGTTTFTAHLAKGFLNAGYNVEILRLGSVRKIGITEPFGEYDGLKFTYLSPGDMLKTVKKRKASIITSTSNPKELPRGLIARLLKAGSLPVIHDYVQIDLDYPVLPKRSIVIRKTLEGRIKGARYIGHPYYRVGEPYGVKSGAISTARVHNTKRTHLILQANELLPKAKRIKILGKEFRLYSYGLMKKWPKLFKQSGHVLNWPLNFHAPVQLCEKARYNVDFTKLP